MTAQFNSEQKKLLKKIGLSDNFNSDMSDSKAEEFIDKVSGHLQMSGLSDDGLNREGQICEDILNLIADI